MWPIPHERWICSYLLKKFLMENLIFCAVNSLREKVDKIQFVLTSYFTVAHTNTQTHSILHKLFGESHVKT